MASGGQKEREQQAASGGQPSLVAKTYLLLYNGLLTAGWTLILIRTVQFTLNHAPSWLANGVPKSVPGLHDNIQWSLQVFQTAAFLEIVHAAVGLVRSNVATTFMQVFSRLFVLWAIVEGVPGVSTNPGLLLVAYAWSITEVVRYSYYFFGLVDAVPYIIKWCRYTLFYLLYPIGVLGELMMLFAALPVVKATQQWSLFLPNSLNFAFNYYYFIIIVMLLYIPLFPQLYGHMLKQRKKIIGGKTKQE